MKSYSVAVIGAGLAGAECASYLASQGIDVTLFEMKPLKFSPAHKLEACAELVCSNSFRSNAPDTAVGLLKEELRLLGSVCMDVAEKCAVPAGKSLAVDRTVFAQMMTEHLQASPHITLVRQEITSLSTDNQDLAGFDRIVVAAGPLASEPLVTSLQQFTGDDYLYFYDAIAPVIDGSTINTSVAFWGSRYAPDEHDYLNCPMTRQEYETFYQALVNAETVPAHSFEKEQHFEGCMPIEALAARGEKTLVFGPFKPVGFIDPRTNERPYAVVQLRTENINKTMFNLVGCQTKLTYQAQAQIFRLIPGLEEVEFVRFGSMHRNTFVNAPQVLLPNLALCKAPHIYLAGQISGVEGYVESAACGLWAGMQVANDLLRRAIDDIPITTALGSLMHYLRAPAKRFQPSNVQFGLMPSLDMRAKKMERKLHYAKRARVAFKEWLEKSI